MKNIKIQNIILYSINFILIGVILLSNKGLILNNNRITLKNMSESTQVSDLNKSINELEESHEEYQNYIQTKKTDLATALTNAGVATSGNDTFETITSNVSKILANKTNDATATAGEILTGKTAYVNGQKIIGTMANNGEVKPAELNEGESYTIPEGYHNGRGKVTANALANQTQATATADNITAGKTAWVNGKLITGNGADNEAYYEQAGQLKCKSVGSASSTVKNGAIYAKASEYGDSFYLLVDLFSYSGASYGINGVNNCNAELVYNYLKTSGDGNRASITRLYKVTNATESTYVSFYMYDQYVSQINVYAIYN